MDDDFPRPPSPVPATPHYHGDIVRILFVVAAGLILTVEYFGIHLPFTSTASLSLIMLLVLAAGITNPVSLWIHLVNVGLSASRRLAWCFLGPLLWSVSVTAHRRLKVFSLASSRSCFLLRFIWQPAPCAGS